MRNSKLSDEAKREFKMNFAYVFSAMAFAAAVLSYFFTIYMCYRFIG